MQRGALHEIELQKTVKLLANRTDSNALTSAEIAAKMRCSKQVVYYRLRTLETRGLAFRKVMIREGKRGPASRAFALIKNKASKIFLTKQ